MDLSLEIKSRDNKNGVPFYYTVINWIVVLLNLLLFILVHRPITPYFNIIIPEVSPFFLIISSGWQILVSIFYASPSNVF